MSSDYNSNVSEPGAKKHSHSRGSLISNNIALGKMVFSLTSTYRLESLINDVGMLEMVVGKEVELIEEVPNVDAAQRIHLREGQNAWEAR